MLLRSLFIAVLTGVSVQASYALCVSDTNTFCYEDTQLPYGDTCYIGLLVRQAERDVEITIEAAIGVNDSLTEGEVVRLTLAANTAGGSSNERVLICAHQDIASFVTSVDSDGALASSSHGVSALDAAEGFLGDIYQCSEVFYNEASSNCDDTPSCNSTSTDPVLLALPLLVIFSARRFRPSASKES